MSLNLFTGSNMNNLLKKTQCFNFSQTYAKGHYAFNEIQHLKKFEKEDEVNGEIALKALEAGVFTTQTETLRNDRNSRNPAYIQPRAFFVHKMIGKKQMAKLFPFKFTYVKSINGI